jgi:hypothetical protein
LADGALAIAIALALAVELGVKELWPFELSI